MGKIELDHTGSGSGITLSSDGTDLLLDGTAIGGGGGSSYNLIVENYSNGTSPTVTGNDSVAIGDSCVASGHDSFAAGYLATAAGAQSVALGVANVSSGTSNGAAALGYFATVGAGQSGVALGRSYTSGNHALAAAISSNSSSYGATGSNSIAMGYQCKSSADSSSVALGRQSIASANFSCAIGKGATASATNAFAFCDSATASGFRSVALGRSSTQGISGKHSRGAYIFSSVGDAQEGKYVLLSDTTDATAEALTTTNGAASATNQVVLPNNSAYAFHGTIVARQQAADGTACAAWKVEGLIRREGSAGTTVLVNSATTVLDNTPNWGMALSADTTNGCLKIEATGAAATDIRWVATIHTSEVTYA